MSEMYIVSLFSAFLGACIGYIIRLIRERKTALRMTVAVKHYDGITRLDLYRKFAQYPETTANYNLIAEFQQAEKKFYFGQMTRNEFEAAKEEILKKLEE